MNLKEIEEAYKTGDWIALYNAKLPEDRIGPWIRENKPNFNGRLAWKLISKGHEDILNHYLAGCEIYCTSHYGDDNNPMNETSSFVDFYSIDKVYVAVPKSLEGCYCDANELHYKELRFNRYLDTTEISQVRHGVYSISKYAEEPFVSWGHSDNMDPKIEYNEQIQKWVYCPKENKNGTANSVTKQPNKDNIGATSRELHSDVCDADVYSNKEVEPMNNFGFTADFPGHIYEELSDGCFIGYAITKRCGREAYIWSKKGTTNHNDFKLTLIEPPVVYPLLKKRKRDGVIVLFCTPTTATYQLHPTLTGVFENSLNSRDSSWEEMLPYNTERGLYHGQPCFGYSKHEPQRCIQLFDVELSYPSDWVLEPMSLETLKTLPFIWAMYQEFIKD